MSGVSTVAILTRDRPAELAASVASHLALGCRFGHEFRLLVLDDSTTTAVAAQNRAVVAAAQAQAGALRVVYAGPAERAAWAARLSQAARVPQGIVEFAVLGWPGFAFTAGANTNSLFLATAGEPALCFDDDVGSAIARPPGAAADWQWSPAFDPTEWHFYLNRQEAWAAGDWMEADLHTAMHAPLDRAAAELVPGIPGRVLLSLVGLRGDSGMANPTYQLKLRGTSRARLMAGMAAYLESRQIARAVRQPTLASLGHFQSYAFGIAGGECFPPCVPLFRGSEAIAGWILRACSPEALMAHLPLEVHHAPPGERREQWPRFLHTAARTWLRHWWVAAIHMYGQSVRPNPQHSLAENLVLMGQVMERWTQMPFSEACAAAAAWVRLQRTEELKDLDRLLSEHDHQPPLWSAAIQEYQQAIHQTLAEPDFYAPLTAPAHVSGTAESVQQALRLLQAYGVLLQHWPALWQAARQLRAEGGGL